MDKKMVSSLLSGALKLAGGKGKTTKKAAVKTTTAKKTKSSVLKTAPAKTVPVKTAAAASVVKPSGASPKNAETITFGPFVWRVLERKGDTALVITEGIIQRGPYHAAIEATTWERCDLRKYLNGKFLEEKFGADDRARIIPVTNTNPDNPWFKTPGTGHTSKDKAYSVPGLGGNPTGDSIFLLSIEEVCRYFGDSMERVRNWGFTQKGSGENAQFTATSEYAKVNIGKEGMIHLFITDSNNQNRIAIDTSVPDKKGSYSARSWWLRSPGENGATAAKIDAQGKVIIAGSTHYGQRGSPAVNTGIRPALWLKM